MQTNQDLSGKKENAKKNIEAAKLVLLGTICGDIIGSSYEWDSTKDCNFQLFDEDSRFTDDTVCTIAIADALIHKKPFDESLRYWCRKYPRAGYGKMFRYWISAVGSLPYRSWGNGSAMRVSGVGAYGDSLDEVLDWSAKSAVVSHSHPQGIKGAQATAAAIYLALTGKSKSEIKTYIETKFGYNLSRRYSEIQPGYSFDVSCQGSVPESIICFLESDDYETTIRKAVAMGGDADTMAAIAGGIAAAYYGEIPSHILDQCMVRLPQEFKDVINEFNKKVGKRDKEKSLSDEDFDLYRFVKAQDNVYQNVLAELRDGYKRTHWMWYIFPQIVDLCRTSISRYYGIKDISEAKAYLEHPVLGPRLREVSQTILDLARISDPRVIFGNVDAKKLRSSMTLFDAVSPNDIFARVLDKYYYGDRDEKTLNII